LEERLEAWKLQARDYEDALIEIIDMVSDPECPDGYEPVDAVRLVRERLFQMRRAMTPPDCFADKSETVNS
jgi:hypothetical protein